MTPPGLNPVFLSRVHCAICLAIASPRSSKESLCKFDYKLMKNSDNSNITNAPTCPNLKPNSTAKSQDKKQPKQE